MTTFSDQMVTDFEQVFADANDFGETVSLTSPAQVTTTGIQTVYAEWIGAIDEKTQAVFQLPADCGAYRLWRITRTNGEIWTIIDLSQRDAACMNARAVLPQETT